MSFVHPPTIFSLMTGSLIAMIDLFMYYNHCVKEKLAELNQDIADMTDRLQKLRDAPRVLVIRRLRVAPSNATMLRANMHSPSRN